MFPKSNEKLIDENDSLDVTVVIRTVGTLSSASSNTIEQLLPLVKEIILVYSGNSTAFKDLFQFYNYTKKIRILRVYSFGYMEPLLHYVFEQVTGTWIILLTDTECPSKDFINDLGEFINKDADVYMTVRKTIFENKKIPDWIRNLYLISYKPILFKRKSIKIVDIIHRPPEFKGKIKYLKSEKYFITHVFGLDYTYQNVVEKIKRYILIELFETRRSRSLWIHKFIEKIGITSKIPTLTKLNGEMSILEYYLYDILLNINSKYFGLTMYQKVRINAIKSLKRHRTLSGLTYLISQEISKSESVIKFLGIENTKLLVDTNNIQLRKLENLEDSEYAFLSLLTSRFLELKSEFDAYNCDPENLVKSVASILDSTIDIVIKN